MHTRSRFLNADKRHENMENEKENGGGDHSSGMSARAPFPSKIEFRLKLAEEERRSLEVKLKIA